MVDNKILRLDKDDNNIKNINASKINNKNNDYNHSLNYVTNTINKIKKKYNDLMPKIDWSQYGDKFKLKDYKQKTRDELEEIAHNKFENEKKLGIDKILKDYESDYKEINNLETDTKDKYDTIKNKIINGAIHKVEDVRADSIKQGIQESSILNNQEDNISNQKNIELDSIKKSFLNKLDSIKLKKDVILAERDYALEKFNIASAQKLNTEIDKLFKEEEKIKTNIEKYNNQILKDKQKFQEQFEKDNSYYINDINDNMQREIVSQTFDILKNIPKDEARVILGNPDVSKAMGSWLKVMKVWLRDYKK